MDDLRVSVILTVLNEGDGMKELLDSIFQQTYKANEIVIVDGGSRDQTMRILNDYAERDNRLKVLSEPGVNIARGRNIAIDNATGEIIAVTDGGCRPNKDWLAKLTSPLMDDPDCKAVAGSFKIDYRNDFEFFSGALCMPKDSGDSASRMFYGRNSAFRKGAWKAVGGYPEWLYTGEDTLFAKRFLQSGFKVAFTPQAEVAWRPRPTLRKLVKMFFLYGKGNGRIENGNLKGSIYWLRYHFLWGVLLLAGFVFPWAWLPAAGVFLYLYFQMVPPVIGEMRKETDRISREFWVPVIVFCRNIATNAGYLFGTWELKTKPVYRDNLEQYRAAGDTTPD